MTIIKLKSNTVTRLIPTAIPITIVGSGFSSGVVVETDVELSTSVKISTRLVSLSNHYIDCLWDILKPFNILLKQQFHGLQKLVADLI